MERIKGYRQLLHLCLHVFKAFFPVQDSYCFNFTRNSGYFARENLRSRLHFHFPYVPSYDIFPFLRTRLILLCLGRHDFAEHVGGRRTKRGFWSHVLGLAPIKSLDYFWRKLYLNGYTVCFAGLWVTEHIVYFSYFAFMLLIISFC